MRSPLKAEPSQNSSPIKSGRSPRRPLNGTTSDLQDSELPQYKSPRKLFTDNSMDTSSPRKSSRISTPSKLTPAKLKNDETNSGSPRRRHLDLEESNIKHNISSSPKKMVSISSLNPRVIIEPYVENGGSSPNKAAPYLGRAKTSPEISPHKRKLDIDMGSMTLNTPSPRKKTCSPVKFVKSEKPKGAKTTSLNPLDKVQNILRLRISQTNRPPVIVGYEKEKKQLMSLIRRTATTGESNSLLLIGPRGCGKSMLIRNVVEELGLEEAVKKNLMLVQLNGLLQTDDRIALREITRQLKLENTVGDKVFGSFAETLQFLLEALKKGDRGVKPILFVLEEFDLFAQHKNQTLLYNLFDVSQSAQAPICVVGITCRLDVVELLEKRVKSRFSHRQLHLFNKLSLKEYTELCFSYLNLDTDFPDQNFAKEWNTSIRNVLEEVSVKDILERQFSLTNDVRGLLSLLTYPICQISKSHPHILAGDLVTSFKLISTDTKSAMLHGVSTLELCLIIAMKHLMDIYDGEPFNFEMVYSEYLKFARRRSGMQVYEKPVVMKAYEHLQTLELIRCHGGSGVGQAQKEYRLMTLLVHPSQVIDALQKYPGCPTEIKQWATQSI